MDLASLTIGKLSPLLRRKEVSPCEVVEAFLDRVHRLNGSLGAYITVMEESALQQAREEERCIMEGDYHGPLHGIPLALKDLIDTKGVRTTSGSKILAGHVPEQDATVVERLRAAGAIILGKANLHEFAFGATNENPHYGPARNPWDKERVPGGSSGGSAVAVAAGLAAGALGSDTGGSVRIPASLCGIVGLKPTYGRVSRHGVFPLSWSMDHLGPMTKSVQDAAFLLSAMAGQDPRDASSSPAPVPRYSRTLRRGVRGLKVGCPRAYFFEGMAGEVRESVEKAMAVLEGLGASVEDISLPHLEEAPTIHWAITAAEAGSVHERFFNARAEDYGADVRARVEVGQFVLATQYLRAQRVRSLLQQGFNSALERVDLIVTPTTPIAAPRLGERMVKIEDRVLDVVVDLGRYTLPFNLVGLPTITVPCGFTSQGLPLGLQIAGRPFEEEFVLRAAYAYEQSAPWRDRRPPLD